MQLRYQAAPHPVCVIIESARIRLYHSGKELPGRREGPATVTHARLLLVGKLGERTAERRGEEHPGVAETPPPPRPPPHDSFHHPLHDPPPPPPTHPPRHPAQ